jgi:hypothetical protein
MRIVRMSFVTLFSVVASGCSGDGNTGTSNGTTTGEQCAHTAVSGHTYMYEPGTSMASCATDSDCFSGFCDETGNPGPYCHVPQTADLESGRGYKCHSDADCEAVAPQLAARGATIKCHGGDPDIYDGCEFGCAY